MMVNKVKLRGQFLGMKMKDESIKDYTTRVNEMAEHLISLGITITDEEKMIVLTNGLPEAYDAIIETLHQMNRFDNYMHISNTLLNTEDRIKKRQEDNTSHPSENALMVHTRG